MALEKIEIKNLSFTYPTSERPVLKNINLKIKRGEFVTLCGKSGSGKTTLLRHLKPSAAPFGTKTGEIIFDGKDIYSLPRRSEVSEIGFVMQDADNQIAADKVWHELVIGMESLGLPQNEIRAAAAETAAYFGIDDIFYKKTTELSGGEKRLLTLAAILTMRPSVLIMDEPTAQLDPIAARNFLDITERINKEFGTTIIISEHRLEELFSKSDTVIVMDEGKICAQGSPREVCDELYRQKNPMTLALPVPSKIYKALGGAEKVPLTVKEGRKFLSERTPVREVKNDSRGHGSEECVVSVKDVWFRYERESRDVIKGLSLEIHKGEFYAILGGNGAGKTTAVSIIADALKPYRGRVNTAKDALVALLPQDPRSLFIKKTVREDIEDCGGKGSAEKIAALCGLEKLLDMHPYDLSGGERQRAALAKILVRQPNILLLDEPTKGLDAHAKTEFAAIIKALLKKSVTVVMVSHDIEFAARYAHRCAMFFDGRIITQSDTRKFFRNNTFYTTAAAVMARGNVKGAILEEDIIYAYSEDGGNAADSVEKAIFDEYLKKTEKYENAPKSKDTGSVKTKNKEQTRKKSSVVFAIAAAVLFVLTCTAYGGGMLNKHVFEAAAVAETAVALYFFVPQRELGIRTETRIRSKKKLGKRTVASIITAVTLIPLTIFAGMYFFGDRRYYFISLLIIIETMIPFAIAFEGREPQVREIVVISVLCALASAGRAAFFMLPQFKPSLAIVIIAGICFGGETGFLVGTVTGFVSNFFFGQGPWTPWQMFAFGMVGLIAGALFKRGFLRKTRMSLAIFGFFTAVAVYGGIMNFSSAVMYQPDLTKAVLISTYAAGLPFDLIHGGSTAFFLWFISEGMTEKLERIREKYGIITT